MWLLKLFRKLYIKTTNLTRNYQGQDKKLVRFYKIWSFFYDISVSLDPAFNKRMKQMIDLTVRQEDTVLDIGCGTGMGTLYASETANNVIGIDLSSDMISKLEQKTIKRNVSNIKLITGSFPEALHSQKSKFNSIISSFAIVHFKPKKRREIYKQIFKLLTNNGRLGLFSAKGEIAPSFETKTEIINNLKAVGFKDIHTIDVSDIYRIITAKKR